MVLSVFWGLVAGFVAAIVFFVVMAPLMRRGPGLLAYVAARALRVDSTTPNAMMGGLVFHMMYGTAMGGVFAWGASSLTPFFAPLLSGVLFGILLFVLAVLVVAPLSRAPRMGLTGLTIFFLAHLVYGLLLGAISGVGSGTDLLSPMM